MIERLNRIITSDPYFPSTADIESIISPTQAREISIAQRAVWKEIAPHALNANGRTGYDVSLNNAYVFKYWQVDREYDEFLVDLDSGDLMHWEHVDWDWNHLVPATDADIEKLVVGKKNPNPLNAQEVIKKLKIQAAGKNLYSIDIQHAWRLRRAEECGILEEYLRILEE